MNYFPTIGLEIHIQLKTASKMFCSCKNDPEEKKPNVNICPICLAHPGTLPVINKKAVEAVLKTAKALGCKISDFSKFDRKNYFYPDLPKGYQISQYDLPLATKGKLNKIRIRRIHLEEDTGKLIHQKTRSLIDFNRAGVPLMELVTEPDIHSAQEAKKFCQDLQLILRYLEVSDANMEKGEMRCEVNISLRNPKSQKLGTKVEIKNLNSFKAVERAIEYEIRRQGKILKQGRKVIQETRGWDEKIGRTVSQRSKEEAHDYRYFPEPDLPPLTKLSALSLRLSVPELPQQKRERFIKQYKLPKQDVEVLIQSPDLADYVEAAISEVGKPDLVKLTINYLLKIKDNYRKITSENFAEFIGLIDAGEVSSSAADIVLKEMQKTGADPSHIIEKKNLRQVSFESELEPIVKKVTKNNPKAVEDYKEGKEQALKFLIGQVMRESRGKANPQVVKKLLINFLASE
jgi:aspartyl-tRNA(Asn)/glutamyl-tRNA(Gln) amidotransferase subunit B